MSNDNKAKNPSSNKLEKKLEVSYASTTKGTFTLNQNSSAEYEREREKQILIMSV